MTTAQVSFQEFLDGVFFPTRGKQKKKKGSSPASDGFTRSEATGERILNLPEGLSTLLYFGCDYPEVIIAGTSGFDFGMITERISSLFPVMLQRLSENLDARKKKLLAFRADSYMIFASSVPVRGMSAVLVKKSAVKAFESALNGDSRPASDADLSAQESDSWTLDHPAEFILARLFLPPRVIVSSFSFAAVPLLLARNPVWPKNTRHHCFLASWSFGGQPLSVRYHVDLSPTSGAQMDAIAKACVAGLFREALSFWGAWKKMVEKPALTESRDAPSPSSFFLVAEIRGEGQRFHCAVEMPSWFISLALKMTQTAPRDSAPQPMLLDFLRANDSLFLLMNPAYRKIFLVNPKDPVPFRTPSLYGLLSLMDDADKAIVIQNFLLTRYELQNISFFFYYHVGQKKGDGETVYRLRSAVPIVPGEIEQFLPDSVRLEWNHVMSRGCMHQISVMEDLVNLNEKAVLNLAHEGVSGKILLSEKALTIMREEILAPVEASFRKDLEEVNARTDSFLCLKSVTSRSITQMLLGLDNTELATACLNWDSVLVMLEKGMSQGRRSDVRAELAVVKNRVERNEISAKEIVMAKYHLIELVQDLEDFHGDKDI